MSDRPTLTRQAHAKLNLALTVAPARDSDGLHPIASWMARIDLSDTLTMQRLNEGEESRFGAGWTADALRPTPLDWPVEQDLAVRAIRALEDDAGRELPLAMRIDKRIPVGAGLGGGSSNAATAMLAVRELFELNIPDERLREIALSLGADVPFFLGDGPAVVTGVGERVERTPPIVDAPVQAVLVPPFACATGAVYAAFDEIGAGEFRAQEVSRMAHAAVIDDSALFNDLTKAAERVAPELAETRARIEGAASVRAHVTGSGSAMFVVCRSADDAARIVEGVRRFASAAGAITARFV